MLTCIHHMNLYEIQRFFGDIVLFTWQLYSKFSYFGDFIDDITGRISCHMTPLQLIIRVATCTGMYWMYWKKKVLGNVLENTYFSWHVLAMYGIFQDQTKYFLWILWGAHFSHITYISHISSHVFTKFSHVSHILMQFILLVSNNFFWTPGCKPEGSY